MGNKPFKNACIDRKNNNGNYEPDNCHWVTITDSNRNQSTTKLSMEKAREIRELSKNTNMTYRQIGLIYNVNKRAIGSVVNNERWREDMI